MKTKEPRRRWPWWTALGFLVAAGVGGFFWQAESARQVERENREIYAAQDLVWSAALDKVALLPAPSAGGADGTYFVVKSTAGGTCSSAEVEAQYQLFASVVADALGYQPDDATLAANGFTRPMAAAECDDAKQTTFASSVNQTISSARDVLTTLGVSEAAIAQLESMRGLDGTQTREETGTAAGDLKLVFQFDGLNGLAVRVERTGGAE